MILCVWVCFEMFYVGLIQIHDILRMLVTSPGLEVCSSVYPPLGKRTHSCILKRIKHFGFKRQPNGILSDGLTLIVFTFQHKLMTPDPPPWHAGGEQLVQIVRLQRQNPKCLVFVKTVALGKWSDALTSVELQPCADRPVAGWECRVNWEGGSRIWELRNFMHGWQRTVIMVQAVLWVRPVTFVFV